MYIYICMYIYISYTSFIFHFSFHRRFRRSRCFCRVCRCHWSGGNMCRLFLSWMKQRWEKCHLSGSHAVWPSLVAEGHECHLLPKHKETSRIKKHEETLRNIAVFLCFFSSKDGIGAPHRAAPLLSVSPPGLWHSESCGTLVELLALQGTSSLQPLFQNSSSFTDHSSSLSVLLPMWWIMIYYDACRSYCHVDYVKLWWTHELGWFFSLKNACRSLSLPWPQVVLLWGLEDLPQLTPKHAVEMCGFKVPTGITVGFMLWWWMILLYKYYKYYK